MILETKGSVEVECQKLNQEWKKIVRGWLTPPMGCFSCSFTYTSYHNETEVDTTLLQYGVLR